MRANKKDIVAEHLRNFLSLDWRERELLQVGLALESEVLPLIHQYGFTEFRPVVNDHRLITVNPGVVKDETSQSPAPGAASAGQAGEGASGLGSGSTPVRSAAEGAEAGSIAREQLRRTISLSDVIEEDSRDLVLYFPQFTAQVLYDDRLAMWYREGWIQPFQWHSARLQVRFYYPPQAMALPIIVASPVQHPSPHLWRQSVHGHEFFSLCYTFAPDRTIDRTRDSDAAAEVLRQVVLWLIKHLVWCRFGFWAGAEVGHDAAEIERATRPDDPCPTHTWARYGVCCRPRHLADLQRRRALRFGVNPTRQIPPTGGVV